MLKHTPGPWVMKPGDPEIREGWSIEAPESPHPLGAQYSREDNVVGKCCSAGVYREEDARLICAAPTMQEILTKIVSAASGAPLDREHELIQEAKLLLARLAQKR